MRLSTKERAITFFKVYNSIESGPPIVIAGISIDYALLSVASSVATNILTFFLVFA